MNERIEQLKAMSRQYNKMSAFKDTELSKIFNRGMGCTKFVEVDEDNKVVYYNTTVTHNRDIERINEVFEGYTLQSVDLPYYEHSSLKIYFNNIQNKN